MIDLAGLWKALKVRDSQATNILKGTHQLEPPYEYSGRINMGSWQQVYLQSLSCVQRPEL